MKALLNAIKEELQGRLHGVRKSDIFITPHPNLIPAGTMFPAVGIKDGAVDREALMGNALDRDLSVSLIPYVQAFPDEKSIMGTTGAMGILDLVTALHEILDGNLLDLPGMEDAFCPREKESEMFGKPKDGLQRKIIVYNYEQRSDR